MELRHLRYFVALAEELHFGRAARRLSITQPPLSMNIRMLEDELNVQLLERNSRRVKLTPAGEAFFARAKDVLAHAESARQLARAVAGGRAGRLQVAYAEAFSCLGVLEHVHGYASAHDGVELLLREQSSSEQVDSLRSGSLDLAFVDARVDMSGIASRVIAHDTLAVCLPAGHALAGAEALDVAALREVPFVLPAHEVVGGQRAHVLALCATAGFVPRATATANQTLGVIRLVATGAGAAIVPASFERAACRGVAFVPIREPASPVMSCAIAWHPKRGDPHVRRLVDGLVSQAADVVVHPPSHAF